MASEYLKKKYKDVKPDKPVELTEKQKRQNWWYYHKAYVIGGAVVLLLVISLVWDILKKGPEPDIQIAYVGGGDLPDDTASAIENSIAALVGDLNGDGQVIVRVRKYISSAGAESDDAGTESDDAGADFNDAGMDPAAAAAVKVQLMADIMGCESYLFILEDPARFQETYHALCFLDGTLPEEDDNSVDNSVLLWSQCPALTALELGDYKYDLFGGVLEGSSQDLLANYYIGRRGMWTNEDEERWADYDALWETLIAGAVSS